MENSEKKKKEWSLKFRKKPNPIAKDLRTSQKYRPRVVRDKTKYDRKAGNKALEDCKKIIERW